MTRIEINIAARKVQKHTHDDPDDAKAYIEANYPDEKRATKTRIFEAWQAYEAWKH